MFSQTGREDFWGKRFAAVLNMLLLMFCMLSTTWNVFDLAKLMPSVEAVFLVRPCQLAPARCRCGAKLQEEDCAVA